MIVLDTRKIGEGQFEGFATENGVEVYITLTPYPCHVDADRAIHDWAREQGLDAKRSE